MTKEYKKRQSFSRIIESKFSPKAGAQQRGLYLFMLVAIAVVCLVALFSETLAPCPNVSPLPAKLESVFPNPAYNARACRTTRVPALLWLTPLECEDHASKLTNFANFVRLPFGASADGAVLQAAAHALGLLAQAGGSETVEPELRRALQRLRT